MARFSLSFLALCFFLALVVSALPAKPGDDDLDAGDAVAAALSALKVRISAPNIILCKLFKSDAQTNSIRPLRSWTRRRTTPQKRPRLLMEPL